MEENDLVIEAQEVSKPYTKVSCQSIVFFKINTPHGLKVDINSIPCDWYVDRGMEEGYVMTLNATENLENTFLFESEVLDTLKPIIEKNAIQEINRYIGCQISIENIIIHNVEYFEKEIPAGLTFKDVDDDIPF